METSNLSLAYLVAELKQLAEGAFVNSIQQVKESVFKIKLHSKQHGAIELIATPNALYKTSYKLQAQQSQTGFAAFLKKQLYNKRVLLLEQHGFDRIIEMHFADFDLVFELFAKGNIVIKDKSGKIVSCYHYEQWKDRELKRGLQYNYPAAKPSIMQTSIEGFESLLKASGQDCIRAIVSALNVAPVAAEEACFAARIEKTKPANSLNEKDSTALFSWLKTLYSIEPKKLKPVVVEANGVRQLLPFSFSSLGSEKAENFSALSEALDESITAEFVEREKKQENKETEQKKAKLLYSLNEQQKAKERLEKAALENRQKAEAIFASFAEIKELAAAINAALERKTSKNDIMYKIKMAAEKGNKTAKLLLDFDPKAKKIVLELPSN